MGLEASPEQLESAHRRWVAKSECPYWEDEQHLFSFHDSGLRRDGPLDSVSGAVVRVSPEIKRCACGAVVMKVKP